MISSTNSENTCAYCNSLMVKESDFLSLNSITVDHILPKSKKVNHSDSNLIICCKSCNTKKSNKRAILFYKLKEPILLTTDEIKLLNIYVDLKGRIKSLELVKQNFNTEYPIESLKAIYKHNRSIFKTSLYNTLLLNNTESNINKILYHLKKQTVLFEEKTKHINFSIYVLLIKDNNFHYLPF